MDRVSIVIPLGRGSRNNDIEIRYCLRSIEKYLTGYGDIFIVGEKPDWLQNIVHIPCPDFGDKTYDKEHNIFCKIMAACADDRVTDDFLFMNDDHYLLRDYEAGRFPYYYDGLLQDYKTITDYKHTVWNTVEWNFGENYTYFDVHCPIIYNKLNFIQRMSIPDWNIRFGYCIKTMYCYLNVGKGEEYPDLKINEPLTDTQIKQKLTGRSWFSIGDKAFNGEIRQVLQELYPTKSKYEN